MFQTKSEKASDRQIRQVSLLIQYLHIVKHINGEQNVVLDTFSRHEILA